MSQLQIKQIQQPTTAAHGKCLWTFLVSWSFITRPSLRCESCVEVLFVRGSGLCFQCRTPIRKANFRYQLFEDPEVQKEIDIRKKILNEYDIYIHTHIIGSIGEKRILKPRRNTTIYKLTNDIDVEETRKLVEHYKKDNKEMIKRNRTRQSSSMEFYERELEREQMLRERREKEEGEELLEARRRRLFRKTQMLQGFFGVTGEDAAADDSENQSPQKKTEAVQQQQALPSTAAPPPSAKPPVPSSAQFTVPPSHRFLPPPSGSAQKPFSMVPPASSLMPPPIPPSGRRGIVTPATLITPHSLITPPSGMTGAGLTNWATSADFHNVHIPSVTRKRSTTTITTNSSSNDTCGATQSDEVVFGSKTRPGADKAIGPSLDELLQPYRPELCGPDPPAPDGPNKSRWSMLEYLYLKTTVEPLNSRSLIPEVPSLGDPLTEEAASTAAEGESVVVEESGAPAPRRGASAALPRGSCGIAPNVFLSRCLQDSRCGLFI
ncbi:unnamed protein product [Schistocephalus solidus]|uniref:MAT1 domain-containing protein n=1 Tax=Schistocephalus solidus TaxID=70667 RepID=A0A183TI13_SCHSO|nr:unnamed protein product [Schistocephalus solidus]